MLFDYGLLTFEGILSCIPFRMIGIIPLGSSVSRIIDHYHFKAAENPEDREHRRHAHSLTSSYVLIEVYKPGIEVVHGPINSVNHLWIYPWHHHTG
jgi:hypothetical protein